MGLLEQCEEVFGTPDIDRVLGVRRKASGGEVRRGYHQVSLQVHPDRVGEDDKEDATRRFQVLGEVYSVLSDQEQRAVYDEQGTVDEDSDVLNQDRDWETYWRLLFKKVSLEDIQAFEKTYKGSEKELADTKQAYMNFKGGMNQILECVLCVQYTEEPRIRNIIQQAIYAGAVPSYNIFVKESKQKMNARTRRAQEEAKEAELSRKELGLEEDNLKALIQSRQKDWPKEMDNFLAQMEAKYCKSSKQGGKKQLSRKKINNGIFFSKILRC
ncbi:LOW QUALITY PROTEIN: dnaJ homolog subfamily C member 9-like [Molossus molossus]|uniref:LOW QUALITY PROTEIN: dnaJ homolog subfamily C member 9-like n=1 Tax=Molossus molossus TaxID=27622 RepID=UPI0017474924|nr:LOW QUALITY PROTEIN: dnaJ homolog subfamily C member 9-like [Molossus molossus]